MNRVRREELAVSLPILTQENSEATVNILKGEGSDDVLLRDFSEKASALFRDGPKSVFDLMSREDKITVKANYPSSGDIDVPLNKHGMICRSAGLPDHLLRSHAIWCVRMRHAWRGPWGDWKPSEQSIRFLERIERANEEHADPEVFDALLDEINDDERARYPYSSGDTIDNPGGWRIVERDYDMAPRSAAVPNAISAAECAAYDLPPQLRPVAIIDLIRKAVRHIASTLNEADLSVSRQDYDKIRGQGWALWERLYV